MARHKEPIRHGTIGGYVTHKRRKQEACSACLTSWRLYFQKYNDSVPLVVLERRKAHQRMLDATRERKNALRRVRAAEAKEAAGRPAVQEETEEW